RSSWLRSRATCTRWRLPMVAWPPIRRTAVPKRPRTDLPPKLTPAQLIPLPEVLQGSPGFLLGKAGQRAVELGDGAMSQFGLKPRHYGVLSLLRRYGGFSQLELSSVLRIDRSTMATVVDELRQMGM